jgi:hypothetical protein
MSRAIAYCTLIVAAGVIFGCAIGAPAILSDANKFLREFVNHELLAVMAVILAITLASTAQLHLEFNKIEERFKRKNALLRSRQGVRSAAFFLILLFLLAIVLVTLKPLLDQSEWAQALFNGFGLLVLLWDVLILIELTMTIFGISPIIDDED